MLIRDAQVGFVAACVCVLATFTPARADAYKDRVNQTFRGVAADKRSDAVLLPLLAKLDPAPSTIRTQRDAALHAAEGPGWSDAEAWAQKPAQTAVIDALASITKEEDRSKAHAFAQLYGADIADLDLVSQGLYSELGEPELLAAARHLYLPAIERAGMLVHVEASRLTEAGKTEPAIKLLTDWVFFCRQIADRPFLREKRWGMENMRLGLERIRDVVHTDMRAGKRGMDAERVLDLNKRLRDVRGFLAIDRIRMPEADFIAKEQLISGIMGADGKPSADTFGPLLARAASSERPLRLFSAAAFWDGVRSAHADRKKTLDILAASQADWSKRWELKAFDPILVSAGTFRRRIATTPEFTALQVGLSDVDGLFALREELRVEAAGTRATLGVYGFWLKFRNLPPGLPSVRPDFVQSVDSDTFSRTTKNLEFFVPMRDTPKGSDGSPQEHKMIVQSPSGLATFTVPLRDDIFVMYSVGPDDANGNALRATQSYRAKLGEPSGDYVLFPPMISLERQRLLDLNQLK